MKTGYKKEYRWRSRHAGDFYYSFDETRYYHRHVRTFNEVRQNECDLADPEIRQYGRRALPRSRRRHVVLNAWNDFNRAREYGKSWKDYTRHSKQWMVADDPAPQIDRYILDNRGRYSWLNSILDKHERG